jgi:hypothetical protein
VRLQLLSDLLFRHRTVAGDEHRAIALLRGCDQDARAPTSKALPAAQASNRRLMVLLLGRVLYLPSDSEALAV